MGCGQGAGSGIFFSALALSLSRGPSTTHTPLTSNWTLPWDAIPQLTGCKLALAT